MLTLLSARSAGRRICPIRLSARYTLAKLDNAELPAGVRVRSVDCLSNCKNGCKIVLRAAARWTYIYGNINPVSDFEQLCEGIAGYSDSEDGIVPRKQRVALFWKNSIARVPPKAKTD